MRSTTVDPLAQRLARARTEARERPGPGIDTILGLITVSRLPGSLEEELHALATLMVMFEAKALPDRAAEYESRLRHALGVMDAAHIDAMLAWLRQRAPWWRLDRRTEHRRRLRMLMLFVLAAVIVGRCLDIPVVATLVGRGVLGGIEQVDALLVWMREPWVPARERAVQRASLDLARDVLLQEQGDQVEGQPSMEDFARWPWTRQVLVLEKRNAGWRQRHAGDPAGDAGPALRADRLEYRLARCGAYGRLGRRGGALARWSLGRMCYRDHHERSRDLPWGRIALTASLFLLAAALLFTTAILAHGWDRRNATLAREVASLYEMRGGEDRR